MTLHVINKCDAACWQTLPSALAAGDVLLLTEDAVYAALPLHPLTPDLDTITTRVTVHALAEDLVLRGISAKIRAEIAAVSRAEFVALCIGQERVVNWR